MQSHFSVGRQPSTIQIQDKTFGMFDIERDDRRDHHVRILGDVVGDSSGRKDRDRDVQSGLAPWQMKRVSALIEAQLGEKLCLDQLAEVAKLSTSYFATAFRRSFGISPYAFILRQRVEFAKRQMLQGGVPLCEIALNCGLADQSHLSRVFRRTTGMSPTSWRHSQLKGLGAAETSHRPE